MHRIHPVPRRAVPWVLGLCGLLWNAAFSPAAEPVNHSEPIPIAPQLVRTLGPLPCGAYDCTLSAAELTIAAPRGGASATVRLEGASLAEPPQPSSLPPSRSLRLPLRAIGAKELRVSQLYPGIDLVCRLSTGAVEYRFSVNAGADPGRIAFALAGKLRLVPDRGARERTEPGAPYFQAPQAWQAVLGRPHPVAIGFTEESGRLRLIAPERDPVFPMSVVVTLALPPQPTPEEPAAHSPPAID